MAIFSLRKPRSWLRLQTLLVVVMVSVALAGCQLPSKVEKTFDGPTSAPSFLDPDGQQPMMTKMHFGDGFTIKVPMGWIERKGKDGVTWTSHDEVEILAAGTMTGPMPEAKKKMQEKESGVQFTQISWPDAKEAYLFSLRRNNGEFMHGILADFGKEKLATSALLIRGNLQVEAASGYPSLRTLRRSDK